jgi:hypothetical protein
MYVHTKISQCDACGTTFKGYVDGVGAVARGATGRWCVVMWLCHDCIPNVNVITAEEFDQYLAIVHPNDYSDL